MRFRALVEKKRSYRRFRQDQPIERSVLEELLDMGRVSASGANLKPLKYMLFCEAGSNEKIFPHLMWAGYLKDWDSPEESERPAAYVVILGDTSVAKSAGCDHGVAAQSILLGSAEKGIGGCMIGSINRPGPVETLNSSTQYEVLLVLAPGLPSETVQRVEATDSIEYYRDADDVHIVPKRLLAEILLN